MPLFGLDSVPDRWLFVLRGLAQVTVEDQEGRRLGPGRDPDHPDDKNQIPGASYNPGQVFSSVFLSEPGVYTFTITSPGATRVHISLSVYNAMSKILTFFFQGIAMTERSQAQLVYATADQLAVPVLAIDREGNGEIETIQPVLLDPLASDDVVPPTTQIVIDDHLVTISASDNPGGAGVLHTYYTTDGMNRAIYTEPFPLPPDARIVMAYSEDRAGNLEYPGMVWPVLGISETHVVMTARAGSQEVVWHTIDVVNLDPISVSGQLGWEASTDVPWLSVEPATGSTPYPIKLSALPTGLEAGLHTAKVIIRSITPGTVFATQTIFVNVEIVAA